MPGLPPGVWRDKARQFLRRQRTPAVHNRTDSRRVHHQNGWEVRANAGLTREPMLLIVGLLVVCLAILSMRRISFAHSRDAAALGWMSEQWLGEHRRARSR